MQKMNKMRLTAEWFTRKQCKGWGSRGKAKIFIEAIVSASKKGRNQYGFRVLDREEIRDMPGYSGMLLARLKRKGFLEVIEWVKPTRKPVHWEEEQPLWLNGLATVFGNF